MRAIRKQTEPRSVAEPRCAETTDRSTASGARSAFNQLDKQELRSRLAVEQGWLCAFCMRRIDHESTDAQGKPTMQVAHRTPIAVDSGKALDWSNMLGSCDGGQRSGGRHWTCDAAQGSNGLSVDPTDVSSVSKIRYERRGSASGLFITSDDPAIKTDVEVTLALNAGDLPAMRQAAWEAFRKRFKSEGPRGRYGKSAWRDYYPKWLGKASRLPAMLGVVEYMLR